MTESSTEILSPRERELLKQLVSADARIKALERKIETQKAMISKLRAEGKECEGRAKTWEMLGHARRMLANKRPEYLSEEEWRLVLESRGICK